MNKKIFILIIFNEFCERFCFYGLKSLLFSFLRNEYHFSFKKSTFILHIFVSLCYLFTLIGGMISDLILGKYKTILYLSLVYLIGTVFITYSSLSSSIEIVLYVGLCLIALGTGGIKPCVAAFGGDQIQDKNNEKEVSMFFNLFYFSINFGSMLSTFFSPIVSKLNCMSKDSCYPAAFGINNILLLISIYLFFHGSSLYVKKNPKARNILQECKHIYNVIIRPKKKKSLESISEEALNIQNEKEFNIIRILKLFLPIPFFWMLFDQQSSTWVEQGFKMENTSISFPWKMTLLSSQMQTFNSIFILLFIPLFSKGIYPFIAYMNFKLTPIKKMATGIFLASMSFVFSGIVEYKINHFQYNNEKITILWQLPQYILLTAGEIMLSMTGLEFAYSEAPESMKTLILSSWLLTVTLGNIFVILYSAIDFIKYLPIKETEAANFFMYAVIGMLASYKMFRLEKEYYK